MIGALAGDIIGSRFEWNAIKTTKFELFTPKSHFTDDSVLSIALAESILNRKNFTTLLKYYARKYPNAGYGAFFYRWAMSDNNKPYNSYGNGAGMRIAPVGFAFDNLEDVLRYAKVYTEITHNHPEGIKGAQAIASCILLARNGKNKSEIKEFVESRFNYNLSKSLDEIRPNYQFDVTCQGSCPQAIIAFLESENFEHSIRLAISLGGDSDTQACMTGGIAQAYYGSVPNEIKEKVYEILDDDLTGIVKLFCEKYNCG